MEKKPTKPFVLIDGSSYLYRAFHAMPSLTNSNGIPTGAVYGVLNMLRKLIKDYDPELMAVIFDAKGKTFRDDLYDKYKAHRPAMPEELALQIQYIHEAIHALGLPLLMINNVEADDVIGTLAKHAEKAGVATLISTGDKDIAQLVNEHITLVNTMTQTILTPETVKEKFGIPPELIIDYLTLVGDTVDNIPGVPKVGPKTAVKWLLEFGNLDNIVANAEKITGKIGENLRAAIPQLPLSKLLATIKLDVPLDVHFDELTRKAPDKTHLIELYKKLEFKTWLNELLEKENVSTKNNDNYETIYTEEKLDQWIQELSNAPFFAFDTETTSLNYMAAEIVGVSFAHTPDKAAYVPFAHDYENAPKQLSRDLVLAKLKPLLENTKPQKIGHNIKYDLEVLANHGIALKGIAFDTMLESYILDSTGTRHDMDSLALKYLGVRTIHFEDVAGKGAKQLTFNQIPIETAAPYAAEDADVTLKLHEMLWPKVEAEKGLKNIFTTVEMPLVQVLAKMERDGVLIDSVMLEKQTDELEKRLRVLEEETYATAGGMFNMNSPKQLQEILFEKLQLPILQKTPTGQPSTADAVLQELALEYVFPKLIIEYRSLSKLITTYTKKLPLQVNARTGRIHTSYNQTGAATGRLSSSDPNLQNIPIRTPEGRRIRQAFIAARGHKLISADYSQIELRIMAHLSKDPTLIKAFENNLDIHVATAAEVLGIPLDKVTHDERRNAKAINFGLIYGMSAFGLAKQLGIDRHDAQSYIDLYFARYPKVKEYMETTRQEAHKHGYVETLWGRRLHLPDIHSSQIMRQKAAERTAINAPLQGTAADIIKRAMISIDHWLAENHPATKMIMQVHDELVLETPEKDVDLIMKILSEQMMQAADLCVPLLVSVGAGDNWDEASLD